MDADERYTLPAIALHWAVAATLVAAFALGLAVDGLPAGAARRALLALHQSLGLTVLALTLLRLAWRLARRPPPLPAAIAAAMPGWQRAARPAAHALLLALCIAVPLLGWAQRSAAGREIAWFGLVALPPIVDASRPLAALLKAAHVAAAFALGALALAHAAVALKHALVERDGLLARMAPRVRR